MRSRTKAQPLSTATISNGTIPDFSVDNLRQNLSFHPFSHALFALATPAILTVLLWAPLPPTSFNASPQRFYAVSHRNECVSSVVEYCVSSANSAKNSKMRSAVVAVACCVVFLAASAAAFSLVRTFTVVDDIQTLVIHPNRTVGWVIIDSANWYRVRGPTAEFV